MIRHGSSSRGREVNLDLRLRFNTGKQRLKNLKGNRMSNKKNEGPLIVCLCLFSFIGIILGVAVWLITNEPGWALLVGVSPFLLLVLLAVNIAFKRQR